MKKILSLTLAIIMLLALFGCSKPTPVEDGAPDVPQTESSESSEPESADLAQGKTIACCMGSIYHPVHRVVQYGFCTKAEELGMNPIISGLDEGSQQELIKKWNSDIEANNAVGAMIWTGDDYCYDMLKALKQQGIYTVVPYYCHDYITTREFIDKNPYYSTINNGIDMADHIVNVLEERDVHSGTIIASVNGPGSTDMGTCMWFSDRIKELGVNYKIKVIMVGADIESGTERAVTALNEVENTVAMVGFSDRDGQIWVNAVTELGISGLPIVCSYMNEANLSLTESGKIDALFCDPRYETSQMSAQSLYELINGTSFETEEDWYIKVIAPLAYAGGEGKNDIQTYRDIYDAAQAYFEE